VCVIYIKMSINEQTTEFNRDTVWDPAILGKGYPEKKSNSKLAFERIDKWYIDPLFAILDSPNKTEAEKKNANAKIERINAVLEGKLNDENHFEKIREVKEIYDESVSQTGGRRSTNKRRLNKRRLSKRLSKRLSQRQKSGSKMYSLNGIVATLTQMLHTIKLYHWRTHSYSEHKATDNLHEALSEQVDSFVEKLLGSKHTRSNLENLHMNAYNTLPGLKRRMEYYKRYLQGMPASLGTDLLNVRDEMLGSLNQFSYLLSLK
jgi:hypothetical protein